MQCVPVVFAFYKQTTFKWRLVHWWFCFFSIVFPQLGTQCLMLSNVPSPVSHARVACHFLSVTQSCCHSPYRIGPREKYFHCEKCNLCLAQDLRGNHKVIITLFLTHSQHIWWANKCPDCLCFVMFQCVENVSRQNCPVCMEVWNDVMS